MPVQWDAIDAAQAWSERVNVDARRDRPVQVYARTRGSHRQRQDPSSEIGVVYVSSTTRKRGYVSDDSWVAAAVSAHDPTADGVEDVNGTEARYA